MSTNSWVLVSPTSKAIVFSGNLMKAPPLSRRGRKKWHDRYFILRANKTFECYKSRRAAESLKSPRRAIDLRECINLEIGLEYKHLQHILSLGTFKRTFFYAAPSDALMLQWANVLEKVKNAQDGKSIEVLDIGLRRSRDYNAVHRVKPSISLHRFSIGSPQKTHFYSVSGGSKSTMALSHFNMDSIETINLRGSQHGNGGMPRGGGEQGNEDDLAPIPPKRTSSLSSHSSSCGGGGERTSGDSVAIGNRIARNSHSAVVLKPPESVGTPHLHSHRKETGGIAFYANVPISPLKKITAVTVSESQGENEIDGSSFVSPPTSALPRPDTQLEAKTDSTAANTTTHTVSTATSTSGDVEFPLCNIPSRVPPPMLAVRPRGKIMSSSSYNSTSTVSDSGSKSTPKGTTIILSPESPTKPLDRIHEPTDLRSDSESPSHKHQFSPKEGHLHRAKAFRSPVHSPMANRKHPRSPKQRRKARKEGERESQEKEGTRFGEDGAILLHSNMKRSVRYRKITLKHEKPLFMDTAHESSDEEGENESDGPLAVLINDEHIKKVGRNFGLERSPNALNTSASQNAKPDNGSGMPKVLCRLRSNSYSKIVVASLKHPEYPQLGSPGGAIDSKTSKPLQKRVAQTEDREKESASKEHDGTIDTCFDFSSPPSTPTEFLGFTLPERPRDSFLFQSMNSLNSLDNILVDPPKMFEATDDPCKERREEDSTPTGEATTAEGSKLQTESESFQPSWPLPTSPGHPESSAQNEATIAIADRHSTESNDTGYTSSASPGYQERCKIHMPELDKSEHERGTLERKFGLQKQRRASNSSSSSEFGVKHYVPLVFHSGDSANSFALEVCLVEDSDELIKDLISLKGLENFSLVDCEEQHGNDVAASGDNFTLETSLEDLEFGFSVVTSTQKDLFMNKVRQFHFEIQELFGCSDKPFSCDVEIKHAHHITTLPIEIERS